MSIEILDCLKRKRDICIKNMTPSQNTAFMFITALMCWGQQCKSLLINPIVKVNKITLYLATGFILGENASNI